MKNTKTIRQYLGILAAIVAYFLVHEGAHMIYALCIGVFKNVRFMGIGMQIEVMSELMSDTQIGVFCLVGALATLVVGWALIPLSKHICKSESKIFKSCMYYVSIAMLLIDPLYLSVLYSLFGGGDMNGISLLIPELAARISFALLLVLNAVLFWKLLLPEYKKAFESVQ